MRSSKWWSLLLDGLFVWASRRQEKLVHLKLKKAPPSHQNFSLNTDPFVTLAGPAFLCLPPKTKSLIRLETLKGKNIRTICLDLLQVAFYFLSWVHHHLGTILMFFRPWMAFLNWKVWNDHPKKLGTLLNFQGKQIESVWISFVTSQRRLQTLKSYWGFSRQIRPPQRVHDFARIHQQPGWHKSRHYQIPTDLVKIGGWSLTSSIHRLLLQAVSEELGSQLKPW